MGIQAAKLFGISVLPKVSGNYRTGVITNPIQNRTLVASLDALDTIKSPTVAGSETLANKFDSNEYFARFGC